MGKNKKSTADIKGALDRSKEEVMLKVGLALESYNCLTTLLDRNLTPLLRMKLIRAYQALRPVIDAYDETRIATAKAYSKGEMHTVQRTNPAGMPIEVQEYKLSESHTKLLDKKVGELKEQTETIHVTKIALEEFNDCQDNVGSLVAFLTKWLIV